jgi:hypothetical protein
MLECDMILGQRGSLASKNEVENTFSINATMLHH